MNIFLSQINPTVGDVAGNLKIIAHEILLAAQQHADVVCFGECTTIGYPARDLLYDPALWESNDNAIDKIHQMAIAQKLTVIVGGLHHVQESGGRHKNYNSAWILDEHFGKRVVHKRLLPRYD